ncbi:alpha/beta hydrolase [Paraneptunicella aestuarii]|uniref:alpha/beta fold hydrolase n=1 Tax=Paraneptunicella aestuarii TaxID=2831148 RepID=UPI001E52C61D|nr:alpha/beta hydrolase [Paraneptunicella aestuarii]UAA37759.1 alpha/beta hydrolase [Paraneptunicella aestuarii]
MSLQSSLAFVPGTMCDERLWQPVAELLQPDYASHHVAIERCSSRAEMMDTVAKGVELVSQQGGGEGANLIGFSMGGYLSLSYALQHPEKIQRLVLASISANPLPEHEMTMRRKSLEWLKDHRYGGIARARLQQFVHPSRMFDSRLINTIKAMDNELGHDVLETQVRETSEREPLMSRLNELTCPVLILGAENDGLVSVEDLESMAQAFPDAQLHVIPESGHMLPLEHPHEVADIIRDFLSKT